MKKLFFIPPQARGICIVSLLLLLVLSCKKLSPEKEIILEEFPTGSPTGGGSADFCMEPLENDNNYDSVEYQTILGNQLIGNPYSVSVMQQASINLYGHASGISVNKKYIRFRPMDEDQMDLLLNLDIELFDYPLNYDVIIEGDFYKDPNIGSNENPWFYTVVAPDFQPPSGIIYEWLGDLYVPDQDLWLEEEAFRITGNPTTDTCNGVAYRIPPCQNPLDPNCDTTSTGGGGNPINLRRPAGTITVWDSNIDQNVPVRRVRVVARRWFRIETVYTDDQGHFQCNQQFSNRVNIFVKFINNHLRASGLFGNSLLKALWPIKRGLGVFAGDLTRINHVFQRGDNPARRIYRHWWAAQFMNAYLEFNEMAAGQLTGGLPTQKMKVVFTRLGLAGSSGVTTMSSQRLNAGMPSGEFFRFYLAEPLTSMGAFYYNLPLNGLLFRKIDMGFGYRTESVWASNRVKDLMYHELAHAAHFNKVGDNWWNDLVMAESFTIVANFGVNNPYGDGTDGPHSEIISVAESWAEHVAQVFCDIRYTGFPTFKFNQGITFSDGLPTGFTSHLNAMEEFDPSSNTDPHRWIPEGLFYDLFDARNEFNPITDAVNGYTNQQFFNAMDIDIRSMPQYRVRLLAENNNNQAAQVIALFGQYNY
jgi:hypothetical protein